MVDTGTLPVLARTVICCPRCGYDQRGVVASWSDNCPLEGTCTECGLLLAWAELIVPEKFEPPWCVEFARRWILIPRACLSTLVRSVRPWLFWSRLKMSQRIRWWRLSAYLLFLLLPLIVTYVVMQSAVAAHTRYQVQQQLIAYQQSVPAQLSNLQAMLTNSATQGWAGVDPDQVKAWRNSIQQQITLLQSTTGSVPTTDHSYLEAIVEAIIFPFGRTSWGSISYGVGTTQPYPPPASIYQGFGGRAFEQIVQQVASIAAVWLLALLLPASLALLPISRRRAKVRWAHIVRAAMYSAWIIMAAVVVGALSTALLFWDPNWFSRLVFQNSVLMGWLLLPIWWAAVIKNYLRMPHAPAIAALLTLMLALLLSPLLMVVMPRWLVEMVLT